MQFHAYRYYLRFVVRDYLYVCNFAKSSKGAFNYANVNISRLATRHEGVAIERIADGVDNFKAYARKVESVGFGRQPLFELRIFGSSRECAKV